VAWIADWAAFARTARGPNQAQHRFSPVPLAMVGFLGSHAVGDEAGPFALPEACETMWTADFNTDDFGHAAVVTEEVLGPLGGDVTAGEGGVERGDAWPFLDGVDQIRGGGIREGIGHLVEDVVVGAQKEASLGTATGDHVVTTGHDLARECHTCDVGHAERKLREKVPSDGDRKFLLIRVSPERGSKSVLRAGRTPGAE
jgi:hypothetical protein